MKPLFLAGVLFGLLVIGARDLQVQVYYGVPYYSPYSDLQ
jgi:hypothetical protein